MRTTLKNIIRTILWTYLVVLGIVLLHYGRRILIADTFRIPSTSMWPTLNPGDRIVVNKLLFGPRIYTSFDFSAHAPLRCIRLPGVRKIRPGDVIVFNFPFGGDEWSRIEFRINYVYCKRVTGCPGDRIGITEGHCWNDRIMRPIGLTERQEALRDTPDSVLLQKLSYFTIPLSMPVWNSRNMGPLTVPARGLTVRMTPFNALLYQHVIEYETSGNLTVADDGAVMLDGTPINEYTFAQDWYFALGDNTPDSQDSRFWGFIPENFIIGIVSKHSFYKHKYISFR